MEDWEGNIYIGLAFDWDFNGRKVHLSIPGYVETSMHNFQNEMSIESEYQPYQHIPPNYGARQQYIELEDEMPKLNKSKKRFSSKLQ